MEKVKRILIFYDYFSPAFKAGGTTRSIYNLVSFLEKDYEFYIFTTNCDRDGDKLDVISDEWVNFENKATVYYASKENQKYSKIHKQVKLLKPDIIHINGFFSLLCTIYPLHISNKLNIDTIIAPCGMLQKASLNIKSFKKKIYLFLVKLFLLRTNNTIWHLTNLQEEADLYNYIKNAKTYVVENIPHIVPERCIISKPVTKEIRFITVALISPMKNHLLVINALKHIKKEVVYDIYGPIKDESYWRLCLKAINDLPSNIRVHYKGEINPDLMDDLWHNYHYYIQPSKSENFGHSIFEAFSAGLPVITSVFTLWQNLVEKNIGWDIDPNDALSLGKCINEAISLNPKEYTLKSKLARQFALEYMENNDLKMKYKQLFSGEIKIKPE